MSKRSDDKYALRRNVKKKKIIISRNEMWDFRLNRKFYGIFFNVFSFDV